MLAALRTGLAVLARHWPTLAAWVLGGEAARYLLIMLAGWAGAHTALAGILVLPLAVAARLISYVAMYLVVRDELPRIHRLHGEEPTTVRTFVNTLLAAVLPFLVFYSAWGLLRADFDDYYRSAAAFALRLGSATGEADGIFVGRLNDVGITPLTVGILAGVLVVRFALSAFSKRTPVWVNALAVYIETVWVGLLMTMVTSAVMRAVDWLGTRQVHVWLNDIGARIGDTLPGLARIWEATGGVGGVISAGILLPAAWVVIVGVIYGDDQPDQLQELATGRWRRAVQLASQRLDALAAALQLLWRTGPLPLGIFFLIYATWNMVNQTALVEVPRLFGPQPAAFWFAFDALIAVVVMAVMEPIRVAIIASATDAFVGSQVENVEADASLGQREPGGVGAQSAGADLQAKGAGSIVGQQESEPRGDASV